MDDLVTWLVLSHLEPRYLLTSRLVNHAWNVVATRLLNRTRTNCCIRMRLDHYKAQHYLQLVQTAKNKVENTTVTITVIGMPARLEINRFSPDPLEPFLEIITRGSLNITSLHLRVLSIGNTLTEADIFSLISMIRNTLRDLRLNFNQLPAECVEDSTTHSHPQLQLSVLKSFTLDCYGSLRCTKPPECVRTIASTATALDTIAVYPFTGQGSYANIFSDQFGRILNLSFSMSSEIELPLFQKFQFGRLRHLGVSARSMTLLAPIVHIIGTNCRNLKEFEFTDASSGSSDDDPVWSRDVPVTTPSIGSSSGGTFISLEHFSCRTSWYDSPDKMLNQMHKDVRCLLETLPWFNNLNQFSLNWGACIALASLFIELGGENPGQLSEPFRNSTLDKVSVLNLQANEDSLRDYTVGAELLDKIAFLIHNMFPNLRGIVVELGNSYSSHSTPVENVEGVLDPLFSLLFRFTAVKKVEIVNYYMEWQWNQVDEWETIVHCNQHSENMEECNWYTHFSIFNQFLPLPELESLTFRGDRKKNMTKLPSKPDIILPRILGMIPRSASVRIDAALLLNSADKKPYVEWGKELRNIRTHNVSLF